MLTVVDLIFIVLILGPTSIIFCDICKFFFLGVFTYWLRNKSKSITGAHVLDNSNFSELLLPLCRSFGAICHVVQLARALDKSSRSREFEPRQRRHFYSIYTAF